MRHTEIHVSLWPATKMVVRTLCAFCLAGFLAATAHPQSVTKLSLAPSSVVGGTTSTGTVKLANKASDEASRVALSSSSASATVSASVIVPAGSTTATFTVSTIAVASNTTAVIKASLSSSSAVADLSIKAPAVSSLAFNPASVLGGQPSTGTVTVSSAAPSSGLSIAVHSSVKQVSVPPSVSVAAGATSATFTIGTTTVKAQTVAAITAKLASKTVSATLKVLAPPPLAGNYTGSFYQTGNGGGIGPLYFTVTSGGKFSGSSVNYSSGIGKTHTFSGTLSSDGSMVLNSGGNTMTGFWKLTGAGEFVCSMSDSNATLAVSAIQSGHALIFAGSYTGSSTDSSNNTGQITSFTISSSSTISGTGSDGSTVTGTVNSSGIGSFTHKSSNGTTTSGKLYFAFDASGLLNGLAVESTGNSTLALAKSYAGLLSLQLGQGFPIDVVISDSGAVAGLSGMVTSGAVVSGTVSATGDVNISILREGSIGTTTVTGTLYAVPGGFAGDGTATLPEGGTESWSGTGSLSTGVLFAGTYSISTSSQQTLSFTIDANGTIAGTGPNLELTGCILASGSVYIVAMPSATGSMAGAEVLRGAFTIDGDDFSGSGTFATFLLGAGTWSGTGTFSP